MGPGMMKNRKREDDLGIENRGAGVDVRGQDKRYLVGLPRLFCFRTRTVRG